jgi:hypothetical protein
MKSRRMTWPDRIIFVAVFLILILAMSAGTLVFP